MLWIKFRTWFKGELVGKDSFGNRYYREKGNEALEEKRWVLYKGLAEASKASPEWHGWLHHRTLLPPKIADVKRWPWERNYLPNLTGTPYAYRPKGHFYTDDKRPSARGDYVAWRPEKEKK